MQKTILLNDKEFNLQGTDLPILIHGKDNSGASLFTITVLANLYKQGSKIIFLSGYHMARDEFISQTDEHNSTILTDENDEIYQIEEKKVIFIKRENADWFIHLIQSLSDIGERVILVKNIDLFPENIFNAVVDKKNVVISGDINKTDYKKRVLSKNFVSKVLFSPLELNDATILPPLEKYKGYYWGKQKQGKVSLSL